MGNVSSKIKEAGLVIGALGVIGFIGLVWLMIYGNLSGNIGFGTTSAATTESITLANNSIVSLTGSTGKTNPIVSGFTMINATGGETITAGNYTLTNTTVTGSATITAAYNGTAVNITYTVTYDTAGKVNTDNAINNITTGFNTFFSFSNTFFTIAAIVLLIFMLVGLLAIVMTIAEGRKKRSTGYSGY